MSGKKIYLFLELENKINNPLHLDENYRYLRHYRLITQDDGTKYRVPVHPIKSGHHFKTDDFDLMLVDIDVKVPSHSDPYYAIGKTTLYYLLKNAEDADLEFAMYVQGLLSVDQKYVWECQDTDYDPHDRNPSLRYYVESQIQGYLTSIRQDSTDNSERVASEIIAKHHQFTLQWVRQHVKRLTPLIASAAITVVQKCIECFPSYLSKLPRIYTARLLWRNQATKHQFADAVFWQIQELEKNRNGRNPSYKQMNSVRNTYAQSYYDLARTLNGIRWHSILQDNPQNEMEWAMHPMFIDWVECVLQYPPVHQKYRTPNITTVNQPRSNVNPAAAPGTDPYQNMRPRQRVPRNGFDNAIF